ncbi:hypothetical protein [Nonomuraea diastatica]|uniref:Uncharacterized protein n=1 Tax=Nonomuraea diastatica TaxID=1848329 RepID=A0A4R4W4H7_9ACTN|nr:hypothetical protein [Nonomuraea diastatica]TDD10454.1 hypothetical protein E1294_46115 [Nonomuraea diastatica]
MSASVPEMASEQPQAAAVCAFCDAKIVKEPVIVEPNRFYWDAVEPQPGVALTNECGARPRPGMGPGAYDVHIPR